MIRQPFRRSAIAVVLLALVAALFPAMTAGADETFAFSRFAGDDRYDTARLIAEGTFATADTVIIAAGYDSPAPAPGYDAGKFPDALAGNFLAGNVDAPILLTERNSLPPATRAALDSLDPSTAIVLGQTEAVGNNVEDELRARGIDVVRVGGRDRYETARQVATRTGTTVGDVDGAPTAIVATGLRFPDALTAGAMSYGELFPTVLTTPDRLHADARAALEARDIEHAIIVGGSQAVSANVEEELEDMGLTVTRLSGSNRQETAVEIAEYEHTELGFGADHVNLARGDLFPDALAGGSNAGAERAPIVLTGTRDILTTATRAYLADHCPTLSDGDIYGGTRAVSQDVEDGAEAAARCEGGEATSLDLTPERDTNPVQSRHTLTATLRDANGGAANDTNVRFEVYEIDSDSDTTGTRITNATVPSQNGTATFSYDGPSNTQDDDSREDYIVACVVPDSTTPCTTNGDPVTRDPSTGEPTNVDQEPSDHARKSWVESTASGLDLQPDNDTNPLGTSHTVTATVRDSEGAAVDTTLVTFQVFRDTDLDGTYELEVEGSDTTNDDEDADGNAANEGPGQATFTYPGPESESANDIIVACVESGDDDRDCAAVENGQVVNDADESVIDRAVKEWRARQLTLNLTPDTATNSFGTTHTVTATVSSQFGPVEGQPVRFEVYRCFQQPCRADGTGNYAETPQSGTATTDSQGNARFSYTYFGPNHAVDLVVACTASRAKSEDSSVAAPSRCAQVEGGNVGNVQRNNNQPNDTGQVEWTEGAYTLALTPETDTNPSGTTHQVSAMVTDQFGRPAPTGTRVTFQVFRDTDENGTYDLQAQDDRDETTGGSGEDPGEADWQYTGPAATVTADDGARDLIVACVDTARSGCATLQPNGAVNIDTSKPHDTATKVWVDLEEETDPGSYTGRAIRNNPVGDADVSRRPNSGSVDIFTFTQQHLRFAYLTTDTFIVNNRTVREPEFEIAIQDAIRNDPAHILEVSISPAGSYTFRLSCSSSGCATVGGG